MLRRHSEAVHNSGITSTQTHVRFSADGSSIRMQTTCVKVLSEAGVKDWGVLEFPYASDNEHVDVHYVRVQKAGGTTVNTPAANVVDLPSNVTRAAPMYSDLKQKQIPVKALGVGDTLEFEVAYVEDKPLVPGQFWFSFNFGRSFVILNEILEIRVPRDKQPKVANADLKPVTADDGAERVYTWTTANAEPTKPEGTSDAQAKPEKPSVQISTFTSWQQVGEWYSKLAQTQAKVTPEIQAKADALVKGTPPGPAQIQAIYDFVSSQIHYIGLSFGIGRYQPHTAADVLENEYGDCKDKHTLLAALLKAEGIEAWPVLINSSEKLDEDVPSPGQFDHLITIVPQGKQYLWLDSTPEIAPYGMLLNNLHDKQALVMTASAAPFLLKTPADPPFPGEDRLAMRGTLDNEGTFKGHGELTMRGDAEVIYRSIFHASARAKWQDVMQAVSYRLGFGGEVSNVQVDDPDSTRQPFHLTWDYNRKKYGDWDNHQITPPTGGIPINFINEEKKPNTAIQVGSPGITLYTTELALPAGSSMDAPDNVDLKTPFAEYHAKYSVASGKFLTERRLTVLQKEVAVADWQKYVAFQKELTEDYNRMSFVSTSGSTTPAASTGFKDVGEAADLIQTAMQSCQAQQLIQCEDELDKAKMVNPHQTNLNASYGSLYMGQGKMDQGMEAFRAELKEHPDNLRVARWFAQMLVRMHRDSDAMDVYRTLLKTAPDDLDGNTEMARMLVAQENWKEAQPILEKLITLRPDNAQVQLWYGQSCLHNGKEAEGLDALKTAAGQSSDPATLATVASALATSGKDLDLAKNIAQSAVMLVEQQTGSLSLQDITNTQMKKMTDLAQSWNSMSLTALKTGDTALAEKYALASWTLAQDPVAGDRLAQIYEKQGKPSQALDTYKLAKARAYPAVPGIDDRIGALEKRLGHPSSIGDNGTTRLQDMRIVHLARIKPVSGSGDFLVLFAAGKVSEVKMLNGDPAIEPYADLLKQAQFNVDFPDGGPEQVIRQGILSCSVYDPKCMFLMMLPADANTESRGYVPIHAGETKTIQLKP
jgi:predicted Zn-dependent protease